jgi:molecular chaperone DnaK
MDLAVAEGAAIQANNIVGGEGSKDILLVDVNPISIGIETLGGVFTKMIDANTTIPCKKSETFTTAVDNQTAITVRVLQGERPMANDNKQLGIFNLEGILPAKRGVPQIEVTFDIDVNGILNVTAKDKGTNKEQSIRIEGSSKLSEDEIARIKAEAEKFADADKKAKEEADAVNKADAMAFAQEKMLEEQKDNINEDEKNKLEGLIKDLKEAAVNKNVSRIDELEQSINEVWQGVAQMVYASQAQQQQETGQTSDDNVQEAEFTEVK